MAQDLSVVIPVHNEAPNIDQLYRELHQILSSSGQIDIQEIYDQFKASNYFEDDILITPGGNENLTLAAPKTVEDVEAACSAARVMPPVLDTELVAK